MKVIPKMKSLQALALAGCLSAGPVHAQCGAPQPVTESVKNLLKKEVTLTSVKASTLLREICRQTGAQCIAEPGSFDEKLVVNFRGELEKALGHIATLADVQWRFLKSGVLLIESSFNSDLHFPEVAASELMQIGSETLSVLRALKLPETVVRDTPEAVALVRSLSSAQLANLRAGLQLRVRDLDPLQYAHVNWLVNSRALSSISDTWRLNGVDRAKRMSELVFTTRIYKRREKETGGQLKDEMLVLGNYGGVDGAFSGIVLGPVVEPKERKK